MSIPNRLPTRRRASVVMVLFLASVGSGCASAGPDLDQPADLVPVAELIEKVDRGAASLQTITPSTVDPDAGVAIGDAVVLERGAAQEVRVR